MQYDTRTKLIMSSILQEECVFKIDLFSFGANCQTDILITSFYGYLPLDCKRMYSLAWWIVVFLWTEFKLASPLIGLSSVGVTTRKS